jgi:hypothetical protein
VLERGQHPGYRLVRMPHDLVPGDPDYAIPSAVDQLLPTSLAPEPIVGVLQSTISLQGHAAFPPAQVDPESVPVDDHQLRRRFGHPAVVQAQPGERLERRLGPGIGERGHEPGAVDARPAGGPFHRRHEFGCAHQSFV